MARIRVAQAADIPRIVELQHACYPVLATISLWTPGHLAAHQRNFKEGQFVADVRGCVVGYCASFRTTKETALRPHTFRGITSSGTFDGHVADGDTLYGAEIMVHPEYRRRGIAKAFYSARFELMRRLEIKQFMAAGRLPGLSKAKPQVSAEAYVAEVVDGRRTDRVLTAQLRSGLHVASVLHGYLNDPASLDCAALLEWQSPVAAAGS